MALSAKKATPKTVLAADAVASESALNLYAYQKKWLADKARFKIGMMARQTGKTFTTTLELVDDVYEKMTHGERTTWVILSRGERQAKEAMEQGIHRHAQAMGLAMESLAIDFERTNYKQLECRFENGSKILALPANPDTARGFSANVFLDEFAFHQDSRKIWTALFPVLSNGYKMRITSTPNGKGNKFYDLMTEQGGAWSKHQTDIYQAVADGLPRDVALLRKALADEDAWAQEFELKWLDEASAWLSYDLITSCESDYAGKPENYQGGPCFVGEDIGTRKDLFVLWVLEQVGDVLWTREIVTLRRASFAQQDFERARIFATYNVARSCMDQTGMGEKPVEDAKRKHGSLRVEGVIFTGPSKLIMATTGKAAFEDRRIRIPMGDDAVRKDLHKLRRETSASGNARFVADSDNDGHADRAWACFLALHAVGKRLSLPENIAMPAGAGSRWHGNGGGGNGNSFGSGHAPDDGHDPISMWDE